MKKADEEQQLRMARLMAEAMPILRYATETYFDGECEAAVCVYNLIARIKQVLDEAGVPFEPTSCAYNPWNDPNADPTTLPEVWHTISREPLI